MKSIPHILLPPNSVTLHKIYEAQDWNRVKKENGCVWISNYTIIAKAEARILPKQWIWSWGKSLTCAWWAGDSKAGSSSHMCGEVWEGVRERDLTGALLPSVLWEKGECSSTLLRNAIYTNSWQPLGRVAAVVHLPCPALIDVPQVVPHLLTLPCFFFQLLDNFFYNYSSLKHFSCKSAHTMHGSSLCTQLVWIITDLLPSSRSLGMGKPFVVLPLDQDLASSFPDSSLSPWSLLASWRNPGQRKAAASHSSATGQLLPGFLSRALKSKAIPDSPATSPHPTSSQLKGMGTSAEGSELPKPPSHISWAAMIAAAWPSQWGKPQLGTVQWRKESLWNKPGFTHWSLTCCQAPKCVQRWLRAICGDTEDKGFWLLPPPCTPQGPVTFCWVFNEHFVPIWSWQWLGCFVSPPSPTPPHESLSKTSTPLLCVPVPCHL